MRAKSYAPFVWLEGKESDPVFDRNAFPITDEKDVRVRVLLPHTLQEPVSDLKVMDVYHSYEHGDTWLS